MEQDEFVDFLGRGFAIPVKTDPFTGHIEMSEFEDDIVEAIQIIIMTRKGERVMRPDFGCSVHDFAFDVVNYATLNGIEEAVEEALILWEPRIRDIEVHATIGSEGCVMIDISYVVRATNNPYNLVYPFYLNEGLSIGDES